MKQNGSSANIVRSTKVTLVALKEEETESALALKLIFEHSRDGQQAKS